MGEPQRRGGTAKARGSRDDAGEPRRRGGAAAT
eukprot:CAMPEP_0184718702 /NCGR_PEP_ID=MMETSP0314-20130426/7832_1 /TAXON_ID=38298 /ORGANISM="Rhodella maculata, Strain CCMP 736" /LENGTH=32 /DNA_ID= /DNA_START= /DNA_END= /DNA_ORIENTATION=